ncbi:siderophore-interacting protein [Thalassospira sp. TSL5-1]|uniref:siderophore-interacting protein n=1 Tax=Thalassospira sp. TSL5-1 TaxID=1544451 RepID=UPI00093A8C1A|nr:siderophore-interacting protein [Thalassospira sp. TSL5-1]OKH87959.1 hypothetical protein LF95_14765 [Thalassospira sp. TSL5-1]
MASSVLHATTHVNMPDPEAAINLLSGFYSEHDCDVQRDGETCVISAGPGTFRLGLGDQKLDIVVAAPTDTGVSQLQTNIITMIDQLVPGADVTCRWQGAGQGRAKNGKLPNFRELTVGRVTDLSMDMRRLRLYGDDLTPYQAGGIHVRLLVPPQGDLAPQWPGLGENGLLVWPAGEKRVEQRTYTIRQINVDAGWMDIDFVRHGDNGPASRFAENATSGQLVGVSGPVGNELPDADWYLFAADETGIPAICRYLEEVPGDKTGQVIFEVSSPQAKFDIPVHPGFDTGWVFRDGSHAEGCAVPDPTAGTWRGDFVEAVCHVSLPDDGRRIFCWTASEQAAYRHLHHHFRKDRQLDRDQCLIMTFWRAEGA